MDRNPGLLVTVVPGFCYDKDMTQTPNLTGSNSDSRYLVLTIISQICAMAVVDNSISREDAITATVILLEGCADTRKGSWNDAVSEALWMIEHANHGDPWWATLQSTIHLGFFY